MSDREEWKKKTHCTKPKLSWEKGGEMVIQNLLLSQTSYLSRAPLQRYTSPTRQQQTSKHQRHVKTVCFVRIPEHTMGMEHVDAHSSHSNHRHLVMLSLNQNHLFSPVTNNTSFNYKTMAMKVGQEWYDKDT